MSNTTTRPASKLRISHAGSSALLLDAGSKQFCLPTQQQFWAMLAPGSALGALPWVKECVLGVNNLLVIYDPLAISHSKVKMQLQRLWESSRPIDESGPTHEVPVDYDLSDNGDLAAIAENIGASRLEVMKLHSSSQYLVACVGSMPGFAYLMGLPERLCTPRRPSPRPAMPKGSVIIGGSQAGIMPYTAPSGWHLLGSTDASVFDLQRPRPCLLAPGDRIVFKIREVFS